MDRREWAIGVGAIVAITLVERIEAAQPNSDDADYLDYDGPLPNYRLFGTDPARPVEESTAIRLLGAATRSNGQPLLVAQYFEAIKDRNGDQELYNSAWERRWNPVIVGFYKSTNLTDKYILLKGDTIPWCAAFANWCLEAAGLRTTDKASSGSFRSHGRQTDRPQPGDIAVFEHAEPGLAAVGRGHVGFFVGFDGDRIRIVGGNQRAGKKYSSINSSSFPKEGNDLRFHSFREASSLA